MAGTKIRLQGLEKRFPGQTEPAVRSLDLDVPEGEIVVLVGPSGCGKTTTLRLINRLIEPSGGRIELDGEDVTHADPDQLRLRMGYVIQQIGLFPHMTIADNIATVPKLLDWDKRRIAERVDELLETVGMEPAEYRERYPKELSGGQSQRIGVARAMAADPSVLLMDEPFGAIDPITRTRLQDEFLRLQGELRKTIVFITHDIDEAVKMGDRIAILDQGAEVAQYDPPQRILTAPANEFVSDFVGTGALLKGLRLARVGEVELASWPVAELGTERERLEEELRRSDRDGLLLLDERRRPCRWVSAEELSAGERPGEGGDGPAPPTLRESLTLDEALNELVRFEGGMVAVVDEDGAYQGVIDLPTMTAALESMRADGAGPSSEGTAE